MLIHKGWIKFLQISSILILIIGISVLFCTTNFSCLCHKNDQKTSYTQLQEYYIQSTVQSLQNVLEPLVGYGKVKISMQAAFSLKNKQTTTHQIIPDSSVVKQETITQTTAHPQQKQIEYAFSTQDSNTTTTIGNIEHQHVSVIIDGNGRVNDKGIYQARTTQEMSLYTNLIKNTIGYNAARGDTLEVLNMPFSAIRQPRFSQWKDWVLFFIIVAALLWIASWIMFILRQQKSDKQTYSTGITNLQIIQNTLETNIQIPLAVIKNWIYMPEEQNNDWTGTQKISILLLALGDKSVRRILANLSDDEVKQITKSMATLGVVTAKQAERVFEQFTQAMQGNTNLIGNQARVHQMLADNMSQKTPPHANPELWERLSPFANQDLADYLQAFVPEISAFILYYQQPEKAAQILPFFPKFYATQVLTHLAHIGHVSLTTHYKLEKQAEDAVRTILERAQIKSGDKKVSEILAHMDKKQEMDMMSALYQQSPDWARKITGHLIKFDDFATWPNETIRTLLRYVSKQTAVTAFAKSDTNMLQALAQNIPPQVWAELQQKIEAAKNTPALQVQQAQQSIVSTAQELWAQKKIQL